MCASAVINKPADKTDADKWNGDGDEPVIPPLIFYFEEPIENNEEKKQGAAGIPRFHRPVAHADQCFFVNWTCIMGCNDFSHAKTQLS